MCDSTMSTLNQPYTFFKIYSSITELNKLCKMTEFKKSDMSKS